MDECEICGAFRGNCAGWIVGWLVGGLWVACECLVGCLVGRDPKIDVQFVKYFFDLI